MSKYGKIIFWSDEDERWVVEVPELEGCMSDGLTPVEALNNAEVVIQEWIDTANEIGRKVPQPKGRYAFA